MLIFVMGAASIKYRLLSLDSSWGTVHYPACLKLQISTVVSPKWYFGYNYFK